MNNFISYIFIVFYPIFDQYNIIGSRTLSLGNLLMIVLTVYYLKDLKLFINKKLLFLIIYIFIHTSVFLLIFINNNHFGIIKRVISMGFYFFILSFITRFNDRKKFWKIYTYVSLLSALIIFYQFISLHLFDIPFYNGQLFFLKPYIWTNYGMGRPNSIFSEPAFFSAFIIPIICYNLSKKKLFYSFIFSISVLISGSTYGTLALGMVWIIYFFENFKINGNYVLLTLIIVLLLIMFMIYFINIDYVSVRKIRSLNLIRNERLMKGLEIWLSIDNVINKVFGLGLLNATNYIKLNMINISSNVGKEVTGIMSTYSNYLSYFGIVGLIQYLFFIVTDFKFIWNNNKAIYLNYVIYFFIGFMFFNSIFVFYTYIMFLIMNKNNGQFLILKFK